MGVDEKKKKDNRARQAHQGVIPYESDDFKVGFEDDGALGYAHVVTEDTVLEAGPEDVSLASFKPRDDLNPSLWFNGKINSKARLRLLDIADDFLDYLDIPWVKPKDVLLTGSLAGYNWSADSDIDLHIVIDFGEVDDNVNLVRDYFDASKHNWNGEHEGLRLRGFPVEVHVEDSGDDRVPSAGAYSLIRGEWVNKPERLPAIQLDKFAIKEKAARLMTVIEKLEDMEEEAGENDDWTGLSEVEKKASRLFNTIKRARKRGLEDGGEMSQGNVVFKVLRRTGHLDRLWNVKTRAYDRLNSVLD